MGEPPCNDPAESAQTRWSTKPSHRSRNGAGACSDVQNRAIKACCKALLAVVALPLRDWRHSSSLNAMALDTFALYPRREGRGFQAIQVGPRAIRICKISVQYSYMSASLRYTVVTQLI